jgi:hypothetical protein
VGHDFLNLVQVLALGQRVEQVGEALEGDWHVAAGDDELIRQLDLIFVAARPQNVSVGRPPHGRGGNNDRSSNSGLGD